MRRPTGIQEVAGGVRHHLSKRFGNEIISTTILSLPLTPVGQLSVTGESNTGYPLRKHAHEQLTAPEMTLIVLKSRKTRNHSIIIMVSSLKRVFLVREDIK